MCISIKIRDRKFFIQKHNSEAEAEEQKSKGNQGGISYSNGDALNTFAKNQIDYEKNKNGK